MSFSQALLSNERIRGECTWCDERAKNNGSTQSLTERGVFANADSHEVVQFVQKDASETFRAPKHTRLLSRGKSTA